MATATNTAPAGGDLTDDALLAELRVVCERYNSRDDDERRRAELFEILRDERGFMLKDIAEAASVGRADMLTEGAIAHQIRRAKGLRDGTWQRR